MPVAGGARRLRHPTGSRPHSPQTAELPATSGVYRDTPLLAGDGILRPSGGFEA